jgi:DNA repair photolyase
VRWSQQTIEAEEKASLPGYRDEAVVRHFEAPDSVPTRFYEVRAKSILNRVPEASRMPFRWTINPFRGCTHACTYCLGPETQILLADGRTKPIADLVCGEQIYGTQTEGRYRRLRVTTVHDKWSSIKRAFILELADGTKILTSGDHRFLTRRGWKHVLGDDHGVHRRPHLTQGSKLMGTGGFTDQPIVDRSYRRGYLCGMLRGDAYIGTYSRLRADGSAGVSRRLRLALTDQEGLDRSREYLADLGVTTSERLFASASGNRRAVYSIHAHGAEKLGLVDELIRWPLLPDTSWMKGFLAGAFDAEGGCSSGIWRLSNTDALFVEWVRASLSRFGFDYALERRASQDDLQVVRMRGGLEEQLRFFLMTDPAISRKRNVDGKALKNAAALEVVSVQATGTVERLYDITTGTGDFIAEGVVSHNCFARPTHTYLDLDAGRDFEREIVVKVNAPERLKVELGRPSWKGEHIALGTNTDPYQWVEGRYKLMRGIWQAMIDARNPGSVLTKSPLLLRDLDLMLELNRRADFSAALSVPTIDEQAWRATEPHTPNPRARLEAVAKLTAAGIRTGVLVAPLMPGINDDPEQVREILRLCSEAGAAYVTGIALHLRSGVRQVFMEWLREERPELVDRYRELYRRGAYAPAGERRRLAALLERSQGPVAGEWERGRELESPLRTSPPANVPASGQERLFDLC